VTCPLWRRLASWSGGGPGPCAASAADCSRTARASWTGLRAESSSPCRFS